MMRAPTRVVSCVLSATALLVAWPVPQSDAAGGEDVTIRADQFDPKELTVEVGTEVTWTNKDYGKVHSVTDDDGSFE